MRNLFTSGIYKYTIQVFIGVLLLTGKTPYAGQVSVKPSPRIVFIEDSWGEALKQAKIQNKHIFVDAYATWCGPCKMLKATTFTNDKAAAFYNSNFINISIDMEKGMGPSLGAQWQIEAYPTLLIFNANGKPVLETVGFINAAELIKFGKQGLNK